MRKPLILALLVGGAVVLSGCHSSYYYSGGLRYRGPSYRHHHDYCETPRFSYSIGVFGHRDGHHRRRGHGGYGGHHR